MDRLTSVAYALGSAGALLLVGAVTSPRESSSFRVAVWCVVSAAVGVTVGVIAWRRFRARRATGITSHPSLEFLTLGLTLLVLFTFFYAA